jgi:hypothetical protein
MNIERSVLGKPSIVFLIPSAGHLWSDKIKKNIHLIEKECKRKISSHYPADFMSWSGILDPSCTFIEICLPHLSCLKCNYLLTVFAEVLIVLNIQFSGSIILHFFTPVSKSLAVLIFNLPGCGLKLNRMAISVSLVCTLYTQLTQTVIW